MPGLQLFYSVKANNDPHILRHLQEKAVGFDVASVNELSEVIDLGVTNDRIILSNTIKAPECIRKLVACQIPLTTVDNERDLRALAAEAERGFRPQVLVRLKVNPTDVQINLNSKFGCTEEEALRLFKLAVDIGLNPAGVHFHVGTQCWNVASYQDAMEASIRVLADFGNASVRTINMGGGFPDETTAAKCGGPEAFFSGLADIVGPVLTSGYTVLAEPGRVLVADACTAVCRVVGRCRHGEWDWLYLDDGIYGLFSTAHYEKQLFDFVLVGRRAEHEELFVVAGPTCDSLDVIGTVGLSADTNPGDYVMAHRAGAYSISVKSHFNGMAQITTAVQGSS